MVSIHDDFQVVPRAFSGDVNYLDTPAGFGWLVLQKEIQLIGGVPEEIPIDEVAGFFRVDRQWENLGFH